MPRTGIRAAIAVFAVLMAACTGSAEPTSTPPPTQALNPAQPTATTVVVAPTSTVTLPPSAADLARTSTALAPTADPTEQARASQGRLALDTVVSEEGAPRAELSVVSVTGVRAGREIDGCGRASSGMALASVRRGDSITEVLIDGETATICGTVDLYDDRPELFLSLDPVAADLASLAIDRAARSAGIEPEAVVIDSVRPIEDADPASGCTVFDATAEPSSVVGVAGYRIVLTAGEDEYIYHTDFDRLIPCSQGD